MKGLKKVLCLVLSLAMVLTSLTVTAFADDYTEVSTAAEFHAAFTGTAKIRLMADITCTKQEVPSAGEDVTIDLNGHKITGASGTRFYYTTCASKLTIEDSVGTGKIVGNSGSSYANSGGMFYISGGGVLNINGGTFSNGLTTKSGNYIYGYTNSTVNITAGRFETVNSSGTALIYPTGSKSVLNISGGYFGTNSTGKSLWAYNSAKINITGDPIITGTGTSSWPSTSFFNTFTGGYYAKDMSSYITDTTNYTQITLQTAVEGCTYKVLEKTASIKYYDGDTEYTDLSTTADAGSTVATAAAPTKAGYVFTGWNTEPDGSGLNYDAESETLFVDGNINLYAQWVEEGATTYEIRYFNGETEYTDLAKTVESGKTFTIEDAQASGTLAFKEWNTSSDGTGTAYAPDTEVTASENLDLYAIWEDSNVSVTIGSSTIYYGSLTSAVSAAMNATTNGTTSTIKLLNNIEVSSHINLATTSSLTGDTSTRTTNFDLNGYSITSSATDYLMGPNKFGKLNIYDNGENKTGAVNMTAEGGATRYFYSPGWSGTQISIYGGTFNGANEFCNYGNNGNNACRIFGANTNTIAINNNVSPIPSDTGYEIINDRYYVGAALVTVSDDVSENHIISGTFETARAYLVNNVDAGEEGTIKLLADTTVSSKILLYKTWSTSNSSRTVYFDLNGHTLSSSAVLTGGIITQNCNDTTYIEDTSAEKTGTISMADGSTYYFHTPRYTNMYYISDVTLTGGTQIGPDAALGSNTYYHITSGTYNFDPTDYLADTTLAAVNNGDGTWTVISAPYIVTYSDGTSESFATYAESLAAILEKTDKTGTIKVFNSSIDATFALDDADADVTIDLNGQTAKMSSNIPFASVSAGKLTIQNGIIDLTDMTGEAAQITVAKDSILSLSSVTVTGADVPILSNGIVFIDGTVTTSGLVDQVESDAIFDTASGKVLEDVALTITAAVAVTNPNAKVTMQYQTNGEMVEIEGTRQEDGTYQFITEGIMLINLDKDLQIQFLADDEAISEVTSYTVQEYLNAVHTAYPNKGTQNAFMAEMIDLAKKLQAYNGSETIEYAGWEENYLLGLTPQASDNIKATTVSVVDKTKDKIQQASISISDKVRMCFTILAEEGTKFVVTLDGETVCSKTITAAGTQEIYLSKITPLEYDEAYIATIYSSDGSTILHQVRYSVNSYTYIMRNDEKCGDVAVALFNYGVAAEYFNEEGELNFGEVSYIWEENGDVCMAQRTSEDGTVVQTEVVNSTKETTTSGSGIIASIVETTADFENPAFLTQTTTAPADKSANLTGSKTQTAYDKHLITNEDGSIGGSYDAEAYGEGAPLNGALDNVGAGYYATNDYYNTKCTDTRSILTGFSAYQQTMAYTDGIASVRMALNYCDDTFAASNSEKDMLDKYESINTSYKYGDNMTVDGLKSLVEAYGYTVEIPDSIKASSTQWPTFEKLIKDTIDSGKIMLLRWQQGEEARWCVVIGVDTMGDTKTSGDPVILAVPFDAYDQYQDGYQVVSLPILFNWWKEQSQTQQAALYSHEALIISPSSDNAITLQTDNEYDNIKTDPYSAEKHLLLNANGTYGGELNPALYGDEGTALHGTYINSDGNYEYVDEPEYNYFGKADYYNMEDTASLSLCNNFQVFQQTMASSCGISSTLNSLNYLGYDFTQLDNYVKHVKRTTNNAYQEGEIQKVTLSDGSTIVGSYDKVQEALLNIYMQTDSHFDDTTVYFNGYPYVGAKTLSYIGDTLGLDHTYSNYVPGSSSPTFTSYDSFKAFFRERLENDLPTCISWAPGVGHWETVIGFDDMGTASPYDDVIVLADSADSHDQYQDGYNTFPANQFYAQWYNGSASTGQAYVAYSALN